jgi:hypothetical protein
VIQVDSWIRWILGRFCLPESTPESSYECTSEIQNHRPQTDLTSPNDPCGLFLPVLVLLVIPVAYSLLVFPGGPVVGLKSPCVHFPHFSVPIDCSGCVHGGRVVRCLWACIFLLFQLCCMFHGGPVDRWTGGYIQSFI